MDQQEHNENNSHLRGETQRIADSIQEAGEAAWQKLAGFARQTYHRLRDETPAEQAPSKIIEQGPHAPPVQPSPASRGPSGVDIVASAAPKDETKVPPKRLDERTRNVEHIAPPGEGRAQEMLHRNEEE